MYNENETYYESDTVTNESGETVTVYINAWVVNDSSKLYEANKFYIDLEGTKVLDTSDVFDAS